MCRIQSKLNVRLRTLKMLYRNFPVTINSFAAIHSIGKYWQNSRTHTHTHTSNLSPNCDVPAWVTKRKCQNRLHTFVLDEVAFRMQIIIIIMDVGGEDCLCEVADDNEPMLWIRNVPLKWCKNATHSIRFNRTSVYIYYIWIVLNRFESNRLAANKTSNNTATHIECGGNGIARWRVAVACCFDFSTSHHCRFIVVVVVAVGAFVVLVQFHKIIKLNFYVNRMN